MPYQVILVPIRDVAAGNAELNAFLRNHRILAVDRRWVDQGADSFWSFCVEYMDSMTVNAGTNRQGKSKGKDYREVLSPEDFAVFARLRDLRKELAQGDAVPVYTIFTNEQLAQMVLGKAATHADLEKIAGVGDARIQKFGNRFLELLNAAGTGPNHEASGPPV